MNTRKTRQESSMIHLTSPHPDRQWLSIDFEVLGRTDNMYEYSDHYRVGQWSAEWIKKTAAGISGWVLKYGNLFVFPTCSLFYFCVDAEFCKYNCNFSAWSHTALLKIIFLADRWGFSQTQYLIIFHKQQCCGMKNCCLFWHKKFYLGNEAKNKFGTISRLIADLLIGGLPPSKQEHKVENSHSQNDHLASKVGTFRFLNKLLCFSLSLITLFSYLPFYAYKI